MLLGRGELCYLEPGNNPLFNFNISKVDFIYVTHLQGASVCSCRALPASNGMMRTLFFECSMMVDVAVAIYFLIENTEMFFLLFFFFVGEKSDLK